MINKIETEKALIGYILLDFSRVDKLLAKTKESDFTTPQHKNIYKLFNMLYLNNFKVFNFTDVFTAFPNAIKAIGGIPYLTECIVYADKPSQFDTLLKAFIKQVVIESITNLSKDAKTYFDKSFEDGLFFVDTTLTSILDRSNQTDKVSLYDNFVASLNNTNKINVDFCIPTLTNVLGYPRPGELVIIGARPAMGKTAFALTCLFNYINTSSKRAVMFSLEMSGNELFTRLLSTISEIPLQSIRSGSLSPEQRKCLDDNAKELSSNPNLSLYDKTVSTIPALRAAIRNELKKGELGLVVVDYLQLITGTGTNNYEKVSEISRQLKLIAREFKVCVVALSQLSRKVEERADKRPLLSDLRESGSIEQDADYVLFLYRHNYYEKDPSILPSADPLNIEVAKNRHGGTGTIQLIFNLPIGKIVV